MVNKKSLLGILVLVIVLIFGMMVVGCEDDSADSSKDDIWTQDPDGNNPGGNNPGGTQSFSFPSQLKNTTWLKDGTTAGYTHVFISFLTNTFAFSYRKTDGSMQYENYASVDSMNGDTYHMKTGGTFTATVSGNKLITTSSSWGSSVIGTWTKQ